MPLPVPSKNEERNDFISRCISFESHASPDREHEQVVAMCHTAWRRAKGTKLGEEYMPDLKIALFSGAKDFVKESLKVWRKPILLFGKWKHPENEEIDFEINSVVLDQIIKNFNNGIPTEAPVVLTHTNDPRAKVGGVKELIKTDKGLDAVLSVEDEEMNGKIEKEETAPGVSCWLDLNYKDKKKGTELGAVLKHVALVNHPYIEGLGGYETVSLSKDSGAEKFIPLILSEKKIKDGDGDMPLTKKEALKFLKDKEKIDVTTLLSSVEELKLLQEKIDKGELVSKEAIGAVLSEDLLAKIKEQLKLGDGKDDINAVVKSLLEKYTDLAKSVGSLTTQLSEMQADKRIGVLIAEGRVLPAEKDVLKKLYLSDADLFGELEKARKAMKKSLIKLGETGVSEEEKTLEAEKEKEVKETLDRNVEAGKAEGFIEK